MLRLSSEEEGMMSPWVVRGGISHIERSEAAPRGFEGYALMVSRSDGKAKRYGKSRNIVDLG